MVENKRDQRLIDASSLNQALTSLADVHPGQRAGFVHDRLMSVIDDSCAKHGLKGGFTTVQKEVLKDIAFNIVHFLDPLNQPRKASFLTSLITEWNELSAFKKISSVAVGAAICMSFAWGTYDLVLKGHPLFEALSVRIHKAIDKKEGDAAGPAKAEPIKAATPPVRQ